MSPTHARELIQQVKRIADALEKANSVLDFSKEDSTVKTMRGEVAAATKNIPPRIQPERKKPDAD